MHIVRAIINEFGGSKIVADIVGISPSAVCQWIEKNRIPSDKAILLYFHAREHDLDVELSDLSFHLDSDSIKNELLNSRFSRLDRKQHTPARKNPHEHR